MSLNQQQIASMDSIVEKLRYTSISSIAEVSWIFNSSSSYEAILKNLSDYSKQIEVLATTQRREVEQGTRTYSSWVQKAQSIASGIEGQINSGTNWDSFWKNVVVASYEQAKETLPSEGKIQVYVALALVALVLILAIKVS